MLARWSPKHERGLDPLARSPELKRLMSLFVKYCGLRAEERSDDGREVVDIIDKPDSDDHRCYDFRVVQRELIKVAALSKDDANDAALKKAFEKNGDQDPLHKTVEWVKQYVANASAMPRNFYGQTKKERVSLKHLGFDIKPAGVQHMTKEQDQVIKDYCDRYGLACHIDQDRMLVHSKTAEGNIATASKATNSTEARPLEYRTWTDKQRMQLKEVESQCKVLVASYGIKGPYFKSKFYCMFLHSILSAAMTNKCWVYDLKSAKLDASDFKEELLRCLINGIGPPASDDKTTLAKKLRAAIDWRCPNVLRQILQEYRNHGTTLPHLPPPVAREVFNEALVRAVASDQPESVLILTMDGASITEMFEFAKTNRRERIQQLNEYAQRAAKTLSTMMMEHDADANANADMQFELCHRCEQRTIDKQSEEKVCSECYKERRCLTSWEILVCKVKDAKDTLHVKALFAEAKQGFEESNVNLDELSNLNLDELSSTLPILSEPLQTEEQKHYYGIFSSQAMLLKRKIGEQRKKDAERQKPPVLSFAAESASVELKVLRHLLLLHSIYDDLLGGYFRYTLGIEGPEFDLFLFCVLMNRKAMAEVFFRACQYPVACALTAACLLRKMQLKSCVDPQVAEQMEANAVEFENLAIAIQQQAEKDDKELSIRSLNRRLTFWRAPVQLMDLAVEAGCEHFVEKCCRAALDDLFMGDILPYGINSDRKLFLTIMTLGLPIVFWPRSWGEWIHFQPPPTTPVIRSPTQRRKVPEGFPFHPRANGKMKGIYHKYRITKCQDPNDTETSRVFKGHNGSPRTKENTKDQENLIFSEVDFFSSSNKMKKALDEEPETVSEKAGVLRKSMKKTDKSIRKYGKAMRLMFKLENDPNFALNMTRQQLNELWKPTFGRWEKWSLFWHAPKVLNFVNIILQVVVILLFCVVHFVLNQEPPDRQELFGYALPSDINKDVEMFLGLYFVSSLMREVLQSQIADTFAEYIYDFWNIMDLVSVFSFWAGYMLRYVLLETGTGDGFPNHNHGTGRYDLYGNHSAAMPEEVVKVVEPHSTVLMPMEPGKNWSAGMTNWKFLYGVSLWAFIIRFCSSLSINEDYGLLVVIMTKMLKKDITTFLVVFCIVTSSFAVLMFGAGDPHGISDKCNMVCCVLYIHVYMEEIQYDMFLSYVCLCVCVCVFVYVCVI